jgi:uncharacterized repeat protein (TIGR03803 family)
MKSVFFLTAYVVCLGLAFQPNVKAQAFTTVYSFSGTNGGLPQAGVILSGNTLYGTTTYGGISNSGVVFKVKTDGTGYTKLHDFKGGTDGAFPYCVLVLSGNTLYGTTHGNSANNGTVFAISTDATVFTNLHTFSPVGTGSTNSDGAYTFAGVILANGVLYGTTSSGGTNGNGIVFAVNTNSTGYTNLHTFTTDEGANPVGPLLFFSNRLYGTTGDAGAGNSGTIFAMNVDGTDFSNLYTFTATSANSPNTNSDGAFPQGGFIAAGSMLYATTFGGGAGGSGTVFAINPDGTGFTNLHSFAELDSVTFTNRDGGNPYDNLALSGNTLFGTTSSGGNTANGTLFDVNTDGTGFSLLHIFQGAGDGGQPIGGLTHAGGTLYGMAQYNGTGNGTIFSFLFEPQLAIALSGTNVILTWPTNALGPGNKPYTLQFTTNLVSSPAWNTVTSSLVVLGNQNTVTNPVSGPRKLYRLSQ